MVTDPVATAPGSDIQSFSQRPEKLEHLDFGWQNAPVKGEKPKENRNSPSVLSKTALLVECGQTRVAG